MKNKSLLASMIGLAVVNMILFFALIVLRDKLVNAQTMSQKDRAEEFGIGVHFGFAATLEEIQHVMSTCKGPINSDQLSEQRIFITAFASRSNYPGLPPFPGDVEAVVVPGAEKKATPDPK